MTIWTLIRRSLAFHARSHFGVVLGATISSTALVGALLVGDSLRESLKEMGLARLGKIHYALNTRDRLFPTDLGQRLCAHDANGVPAACPLAQALGLRGVVARQDATARANRVNVLGVQKTEWAEMAGWKGLKGDAAGVWKDSGAGETAFINETLAGELKAKVGDELVLRVQKPTALGLDAVITPRNEDVVAIRLKVGAILSAEMLGDYSLFPGQVAPANLFVALETLDEKLGLGAQVNLLFEGGTAEESATKGKPEATKRTMWLDQQLDSSWKLEDGGLAVRILGAPSPGVEVSSSRIFLEAPVVAATKDALPTKRNPQGVKILTYLANLIEAGEEKTPYSMITAAEGDYVPQGMKDDEIIVNQWLADDLKVKRGDTVRVSYHVVDSGTHLVERTNTFKVSDVVPLAGKYADRSLMPEFPGLAKAESTHDWDAGFPLVHPFRDKDELYWKQYRGTPKAFITLAAGQAMWANRFGNLTAVRFPIGEGGDVKAARESVYANVRAHLTPEMLGFQFEAVREEALAAAENSQPFDQLFLGFSIFLVVAALLLMAILFQFGLEQRVTEIGTLLAVGFRPKMIRRWLLGEGAILALVGGLLGAAGGVGYAKAMVWGLTTLWRSAVGTSALQFHATGATLGTGIGAGTLVAVLTLWLALRKQARRPARELLAGETQPARAGRKSRGNWLAWGFGVCALATVGWAVGTGQGTNAEVFFSAGACLLIAGLGATASWLWRMGEKAGGTKLTFSELGRRGCGRRRSRSLACVALLASGCFVVASIGAFRLDANQNATRKDSGTGGFALLADSTVPVVRDLNTQAGREAFGMQEADLAGVNFVSFRVRDGDEASCLNLNAPRQPRLLGVKPEALAGRFTLEKELKGATEKGWELLKTAVAADEVPAIGDANSLEWALHKAVGDTIDYVDESGRSFKVKLIGAVANSILQGSLIVDEGAFTRRFPGESGYRMFLIDAPSNQVTQVSATLSRALEDVGLEVNSTVARLNAFNAVQNTYLSTFQVLGGLGLLVGSAGLGVVVLRNVLERRGELALLAAVGFRRRELQRLVLSEHGWLLLLGLALGVIAAALAVLPSLISPATHLPYVSLGLTLAAVCANGLLWTWAAMRFALRGDELAALRNE